MLLADRGYDADWIRDLAMKKGAWANIPPKCNRNDPICFSPYLYRARKQIEATGSSNVVGSQRATTGSPPTSLPSCNSRQSGYGCVFMSPRPSTTLAESICAGVFHGFVFGSMDTVETAAEG
ncbi:hypothetical protein GGD64_008347 [Bradyrhizobium sp. CIR3A]|nr:hypothetical protein [Bradyrhizobium sp. CIR3A]